MLCTPVVLIVFNRPDHVRRVLGEIRKQQPEELFICQDGPRDGNELDRLKIQEVRDVINEMVDWPCELHTLYQEKNLGCGAGPAAGISWFFSNVEMGIVMEDDCLPHPDFFAYCDELLHRYKDDERIMYISSTLYNDKWRCSASYDFSHYMITGAWASWSRAWKGFDLDLHHFDARKFRKKCLKLFYSSVEADWWFYKVLEIQQDTEKKSYWDYQMQIHILDCEGVTIHPQRNLVSNIGFDAEGTHTLDNSAEMGNKESFPIMPLSHPSGVVVDRLRDYECFSKKKSQGFLKEKFRNLYLSMLFSGDWRYKLLLLYKRLKGQSESSVYKHV